MAQKLRLVDEKKEDKKNKGLRLVDSPSTPNPLPSAPKTPSPFTPNEESAPRVQTIKLVDDPSQTIFAEDQKVDLLRSKVIENFDQRLERFYSKGEYPSVDNESLDKYLDAKYGDVWHDDFWAKARRGGATAGKMLVEDLFVGLFYEGPKQGALTEMQGAVDGLVENKVKNLKLKKEYGKLIGPVTRQSLRSPFSGRTGSSADILQRLTFVEERRLNAIHNAMKSLVPLEKTLSGENPTKEKMDLFKKFVVAVNRRSAVDAKSIVPEGSDLKKVALKSSGDLFEDGSSKVDDFLTMAKFALKTAHPLGTPLKSTATATEAVARGGADIGMIGNMIANNAFDNTQKHQEQVNRHINTKLKEHWSERNLEYEPKISEFNYGRLKPNLDGITGAQVEEWLKEIPGPHNKLKEARRDQWTLMQVLITDRERARRGLEPIISQYSKNLGADRVADWYAENVNSRMAEGLSYGLDPVTIGTMGYAAVAKQAATGATRGVLRDIGSSAVRKSGEALESVGEKISKTASKIDEVAGEGVAGGIIGTGVGLATEAPLPGSVVAGVAGGSVLQPVQKLATVGEAVSATGQTLRATGEILSSAPGSEGFMRRMSISSTAPKRVANLAAKLEILDPAITLAADITKGTATGTAIGVGLTAATGEGTEMIASGAVTGGALGGLTVLPSKLVTPDAEIKRAADVNAWLERQPEPIREILKTRPFKDQQAAAELDLFARGFGAYEGKADVPIEYYFAKDKNEGAYLIDEGRIKINLNYDGPRTLAHEIGHAIKGLAMADAEGGAMRTAYEKIRGLIFDRTIGDSTVKGIYSIDDEVVFAKQYLSRMRESRTPEQYQQWASENGFDFGTAELTKEGYQSSEKARSVVQGEIEAETFSNFIQGKGPGAITGAGSAKSRLLNHIMLSEHSKTLSGMRYVLENVFKIRFDSDGGVSKMFIKDGKGITNSPKVNAAIEEFVAARRAIRERISPASEGESTAQVFTLDEVKSDPGMVEYFAAHDAFARNDDGDIVVVNGKPVILNKTEIGKLQRNRVKEITKALESVDEIGGLQVSTTNSGKKRWSGKNFSKEQLDALLALPDDVFSPRLKENLQFIYDKINEGSSIHYDYNAATTLGKYSSQISAAWRHDMPFSIEITQAGNFLVKGVNVDRINAKIAKWKSDKKGRYLDLWDNNFKDFYTNLMQYMANHREGKRGADGLSPDPVLAKRRAERINELFGVSGSEANRAETIGGKVKRGAESSRRFDRINQLRSGDGDWSVDYNSLRKNLMPAGADKGGAENAKFGKKGDSLYMPAVGGAKVARVTGKDTAVLDKDFSAQFMPSPVAPNAVLKDFHKKKVQILTTDLTVAADKAVDGVVIKFGGGPGHLGWHDGWGYTNEGSAIAFGTRWEREGKPLIGITSLTPNNHLNQPLSREYYTAKWREVIEDGLVPRKLVDRHIREALDRVVKSKATKTLKSGKKIPALPDAIRESLAKVKTFKQFSKIFHDPEVIPWTHAPTIYKKLDAKTLPISNAEQVKLGTDLESVALATRQPEYNEAPIGSLLAIAEYDGSAPTYRPDLNKAYPWFVPLKEKAFLKQIHDVRKLSTDKDLVTSKGNVNPGTMMGKGIMLDRLAKGDVQYMPAGKGGDIFYSNSSKALESPKVRNSATGAAMLNDIIRQDPAARQEMKWIDLDRWLMDKKGKVTKEEVQDFIDTNQIAVVEKVRGGDESPEIRAAEEAVEYAERNMWDADDRGTYEDYREAEAAYREAVNELEFVSKDFDPQFADNTDLQLPGAVKGSYRELELMLPKRKGEQFKESHFETDENVFAHVRFNERIDANGKRMLFIEEVQSDWAAKGRDVGFNKPYINGDIVGGREESVPAAPFVSKQKGDQYVKDDKWRALAMKRMIRWGADNFYDRVGWITGRDSADRYNLNTYVSKIEYMRLPGENQTMISAWDKAGSNVMSAKMIPNKDLVGTVGKDLARKIDSDKSGMGEFDGLDLTFGGKFHKQFYDVDLPNYTGKYVKKWGGKVGEVEVSDTKAHYVDITPEMKAEVQQGQAMFMPAGEGRAPRRMGSATSRPARTRIPMGAAAKQLRMERDLKELKRN